MHGDIDNPAEIVLTKADYERYSLYRGPFTDALSSELASKSFLFIGFSFLDPNLTFLFSRLRLVYSENQREHYAIFKRVTFSDFSDQRECDYESRKQNLMVEDLKRINITCILIDRYSEIETVLEKLRGAPSGTRT